MKLFDLMRDICTNIASVSTNYRDWAPAYTYLLMDKENKTEQRCKTTDSIDINLRVDWYNPVQLRSSVFFVSL